MIKSSTHRLLYMGTTYIDGYDGVALVRLLLRHDHLNAESEFTRDMVSLMVSIEALQRRVTEVRFCTILLST